MVNITIAIPTLNRRDQLERAIDSCLAQEWNGSFEILVSNNMSSDGTREYLDSLDPENIRIFHQDRLLNMRDNWQFLLDRAAGEYFILLSDDDWFTSEDSLKRLMRPFAWHDGLKASISNVRIVHSHGEHTVHSKISGYLNGNTLLANYFGNEMAVYPAATIFRLMDMKEAGGYRICKSTNAIDAEILMKTVRSGNVYYEGDALLNYTLQHSQSNRPPSVAEEDFDCLIELCGVAETLLTTILKKKKKLAVYAFVVRNLRTGNASGITSHFLRHPLDLVKVLNIQVAKHLFRRIFG